ncbi:hypothetical protein [Tsukamurella sp. USMM236]|uniref:hypothetical protein n=1 Tax=Tsukamurella sp. USMM236 TaxID=3081301 RepID=UPI003018BD2C
MSTMSVSHELYAAHSRIDLLTRIADRAPQITFADATDDQLRAVADILDAIPSKEAVR